MKAAFGNCRKFCVVRNPSEGGDIRYIDPLMHPGNQVREFIEAGADIPAPAYPEMFVATGKGTIVNLA